MVKKCEIDFVEFEKEDLRNYALIEGFPGLGLAGTIGAKYLVERLKFEEYGYLTASIFLPIVRIHDGLPVYPSRIYINKEKKLLVLISEQIIPKNYTDHIAKCIVGWLQEKGIKKVISLSGITVDKKSQKIYGIAANQKSKELLKKYGVEGIKEGITTGITALILMNLKNTDIEAVSILGNVTIAADYKAAAGLIKKLNEMLNLNIDIKPLLKEAKETEKELVKQMHEFKKTNDTVQKFETKTPMYT